MQIQKITPYLWFDTQAEEAARFYCSLFPNSKILSSSPMMVVFELSGQRFMALNGGPKFTFNEAVSLFVSCDDQVEVDRLWKAFIADGGGRESWCGWLKDRFGLSWQIVPTALMRLMGDGDPAKAKRVTEAMLKMQKFDIATLERAHAGK